MNNKLKKVINTAFRVENKNANFLSRLLSLITNPFYYLFKGKWRI